LSSGGARLVVYGCYVLILRVSRGKYFSIGRLGRVFIDRGLYFYVGSGFGSGGVWARVKRHLRRSKRVFWHIDYLTIDRDVSIDVVAIIPVDRGFDCESYIAGLLSSLYPVAVRGFGCSDKKGSVSHLFRCVAGSIRQCVDGLESVLRKAGLTVEIYYTTDL